MTHRTPGPFLVTPGLDMNLRGQQPKGFFGLVARTDDSAVVVARYMWHEMMPKETALANATAAAHVDTMLRALGEAVIAMGRAGANADVNHPQRTAWETCQSAINSTMVQS